MAPEALERTDEARRILESTGDERNIKVRRGSMLAAVSGFHAPLVSTINPCTILARCVLAVADRATTTPRNSSQVGDNSPRHDWSLHRRAAPKPQKNMLNRGEDCSLNFPVLSPNIIMCLNLKDWLPHSFLGWFRMTVVIIIFLVSRVTSCCCIGQFQGMRHDALTPPPPSPRTKCKNEIKTKTRIRKRRWHVRVS
jgi:hypothetical protein